MKKVFFLLIGWALLFSGCAGGVKSVTENVYFLNVDRYAIGTEPYEDAVTRSVAATGSRPEAVLRQVFLGPTAEEKAKGLDVVLSGTTGFSKMTLQDGIARVYLTGKCNSGGSTYTIRELDFCQPDAVPRDQVGQDLRRKRADGNAGWVNEFDPGMPGTMRMRTAG